MFVSEWMTRKVHTVGPGDSVSDAARLMREKGIKHMPVVKGGSIRGIISDRDIFRALVDITGVRHGGHRIYMTVEDGASSIKEAADIIRKHGFSLQGLMTSYEGVRKGMRKIVVRTKGNGNFRAMKAELGATYRDVRIKKG